MENKLLIEANKQIAEVEQLISSYKDEKIQVTIGNVMDNSFEPLVKLRIEHIKKLQESLRKAKAIKQVIEEGWELSDVDVVAEEIENGSK